MKIIAGGAGSRIVLLFAVLGMVLFSLSVGFVYSQEADTLQCPENKIAQYFRAAAERNTEEMWLALSPDQVAFGDREALEQYVKRSTEDMDNSAGERVRQKVADIFVEPIDTNENVCNYRALITLESRTSRVKITDHGEFRVLMDGVGILELRVFELLPPSIEQQRGT